MPVVADVDADLRIARLEHRIAEVARLEEVLLPEARRMRDVILAVLAEVRAVVVVDGGGVVVDARRLALVHGHDHRHLVLLRELRHELARRSRHRLGDVVPVRVLRRTEVRPVEDLLEAEDLHALLPGFLDERHMSVDRRLPDFLDRRRRIRNGRGGLNQSTNNVSGHSPVIIITRMNKVLATTFTGLRFENPFLLASAPPTESESNIMRAFDAGWGGVVTKTIGLHPVTNVAGPKTKFLRSSPDSGHLSIQKRPGAALHSSWNWELISDKALDWWIPRLGRIKKAHPTKMLIASVMAGSGSDEELRHWQELAKACQNEGCDGIELNLSCPHMDRKDMGSNIGKDPELISVVAQAVKEVVRVPVWAKLTPSTTEIVVEARGAFLGGADAITSSNTFPSLPLIDPDTLEFEMNVDGLVSPGGLGGPAILPLSLAKMAQMTQAFPDKSFSGIGGIAEFAQ